MNHFLNIVKKEVKELLTPATLVPIIVMALLFATMGNMIGGAMEEAKEKPVIGIIDSDKGNFSFIVKNVSYEMGKVIYNGSEKSNIEEGLQILKEKGGTALLFIPENFSSAISQNISGTIHIYWIMRGAGIMDGISSGAVEGIIYAINQKISRELIKGKVNASFVLAPLKREETTIFKGKEMEGISPNIIGQMLSSQSTTVPIIMMMIIIMAGGMVISCLLYTSPSPRD